MIATVILHETGQRMSAELKEMEQKRVAEFRPSKSFKWDYGFDWFREGRDDGNINFKKIYDRPLLFDNFEKEYEAQKIDYSGWSERIKDKDNRYCSWLSLYPPDAGYGVSVAKLRLLIYDGDKSKRPLKLEYDKDCFRITPDVFPPDKKSTKGHIYKEEITIECLKEFSDKKAIRVLTNDDRDEEVGCLYVMPNDASHRYKLKTRLVKVYLLPKNDKTILDREIDPSNIEKFFTGGALSHCFVRPVVESEVRELDLTHRSDEWKGYMKKIPSEDGRGMETVIAREYLDTVFESIKKAYYTPISPEEKKNGCYNADTDGDDRLIIFFINWNCKKYTENQEYGMLKKDWEGDAGYSSMPGLSSLIMQNGVNAHTLNHEILHTLGLNHTFPDMDNMTGHLFAKHETDNIMDYSERNSRKKYPSTYKWQWDIVWATTVKRQIPNDN